MWESHWPGARDAPSRRRDTILAALEVFRSLYCDVTVTNIVLFLYVAENEGLNFTELAAIARLSKSTVSRSIRALTARASIDALPPSLGLVEVCSHGIAHNSKTLRLTEKGRTLCARIDRLIGDPVPIVAANGAFGASGPPVAVVSGGGG